MERVNTYILHFSEIDRSKFNSVGGKGANLGELSRIKNVYVPEGFCVSTELYRAITENNDEFNSLIDQLANLKVDDRKSIGETSAKIRKVIEEMLIPAPIVDEIIRHVERLGENDAYAVRSSATAEDLPTASFAGQQDTYLNVIGRTAILEHISKCWASLFTERAVTYRIQNGFDHRKIQLAVVVQKMIFPQVSGIMFTADPITGNRKVVSIDASFGLGEALVSGLVNADNYKVSKGKVVDKKVSTKMVAIRALDGGGTKEIEIPTDIRNKQALTDEQILRLARIGRTIESHFGSPQDIEWCSVDDNFYIVQSRPITTLFPIPEANDDDNHVYISVGHQQMMTDAMKPLGLSFWLFLTPAKTHVAAGRLFVDVAPMLASSSGRETIVNVLGKFDPLIKDALTTILERGDLIKTLHDDKKDPGAGKTPPLPDYSALNNYDATVPARLIKKSQESIEQLKQEIQTRSGTDVFDFIIKDIEESKKFTADPESFGVIMTGMNAATWINEKMNEWLGEKNVADTLAQSAPNNVTSEMGLELLDVADVIRPYPKIIGYLEDVGDENLMEELNRFEGGQKVRVAIEQFLKKYGMRCSGEIDITKSRWIEKPTTLLPAIVANIKNFEPGEGARKFAVGRQEAMNKEQELLTRLRQLPDGEQKAKETKPMIDLLRNLAGYREYPKYAIVSRYFAYKQALMREAEKLVDANVLQAKEDIYYLNFSELRDVVRTNKVDYQLIEKRKQEFKSYEKLTPPRVITSDGEIVAGKYKRENLPVNAIPGLAVSSGVIEGTARVILNLEDADLQKGDILVTTFTDPSWTPLFVSISGLITEVGGLMTHGAVIAREYGIPAVVGLENATQLIKDGQRIRVNGTEGYVELLT